MGELAEMHLNGTLCEICGVFLDGETSGYPRYCEDCQKQQKEPTSLADEVSD